MGKFSETLMDHFTSPRNTGTLESPDRIGQAGTLGNGPYMVLYLRIKDDVIVEAKYRTYGCGTTIAAGSILTELVTGRSIAACLSLTVDDLITALEGVPPDKLHSPALAIAALQDALEPVANVEREPP
jgi:nitrogen fixation NifU-like protein